jgi:hypothetical protein
MQIMNDSISYGMSRIDQDPSAHGSCLVQSALVCRMLQKYFRVGWNVVQVGLSYIRLSWRHVLISSSDAVPALRHSVKTVFLLARSAQLGMYFLNCKLWAARLFLSYARLTRPQLANFWVTASRTVLITSNAMIVKKTLRAMPSHSSGPNGRKVFMTPRKN